VKYLVKQATAADLNHLLNSVDPGWIAISIVPYGTSGTDYLVIFKQC